MLLPSEKVRPLWTSPREAMNWISSCKLHISHYTMYIDAFRDREWTCHGMPQFYPVF